LPKSVLKKNQRAPDDVSSALAEAERVIQETRHDALDLFHARGVTDRAALAKWLIGARDACWHITDVVERETAFVITIAIPGVHAELVELTREPRQLVVRTRSGSDSDGSQVLRRLDLPIDLTSERLKAEMRDGALVITAPKLLD
jgi:HSP20 family molecular chaperone IbpA